MDLRHVEVVREGDVVRVVLSGELLCAAEAHELTAVATGLVDDRSVRVVVLASRRGDFCPGPAADLDPLAQEIDPAAALALLRVPVVAALSGAVTSVGLEVALAADLRVLADDALLSMPDLAHGRLPCWGGIARLSRAVGRPAALSMLLTGLELGAARAEALGLGTRVGAADGLDGAVKAIVEQLLEVGPLALEYAKEAVLVGSELPMRDGLRVEADLNNLLAAASADRAEGLAAFFEKRPPSFGGS